MKTAEQWCKDEKTRLIPMHVPDIQQIQLDAMREGMRRAAKIAKRPFDPESSSQWPSARIIRAAESLTDDDL